MSMRANCLHGARPWRSRTSTRWSRLGRLLARREQRESFALYAHGILTDGERKSVEPIAARTAGSDDEDQGET